jgi:hypothetical protein
MKEVMEEAELNPQDRKERKEVDLTIRSIVGEDPKEKCNVVWKEVKVWLHDEEKRKQLVEGLRG